MRLFLAIDLPAPVRGSLREAEAGLRESCPGGERYSRIEGFSLGGGR